MALRSGSLLSLLRPTSGVWVPDGELLGRLRLHHDELAFTELVRRHGPMVFAVCRRLLPRWHDAEDAFQATFLVLACKPGAIHPPERLGAWLHGVASRIAQKSRRTESRRLDRESRAAATRPMSSLDPMPDDVRTLIDEALLGLPQRYRAAIVLCDLEGLTRKDAAHRLGWSEGLLSGRLARGRKLLAERLTRRGVALGAGGLATGLVSLCPPAVVARELTLSTLAIIRLVRTGLDVLPPGPIAALAQGVTRSLLPTRINLFAGSLGIGLAIVVMATIFISASARPSATAPAPVALTRLAQSPVVAQAPKPDPIWRERITFKHPATVTALAFGPADLLYAGDADGGIVVWDLREGKERVKILDSMRLQMKTSVDALALHPDARWLYVVSNGRESMHAMNLEKKIGNGRGGEKYFGFTPDGRAFITAGVNDATRIVFQSHQFPENVAPVPTDLEHKADVAMVATANKDFVATMTTDNTVHAWDTTKGKLLWSTTMEKPEPTTLAIAPGGDSIAVADKNGVVRLLDGTTGKESHRLGGHTSTIHALVFSGDGKLLVTASADRTIRTWNLATRKEMALLHGHTDAVCSLVVNVDGTFIASGSADKTIKVWERKP